MQRDSVQTETVDGGGTGSRGFGRLNRRLTNQDEIVCQKDTKFCWASRACEQGVEVPDCLGKLSNDVRTGDDVIRKERVDVRYDTEVWIGVGAPPGRGCKYRPRPR